MIPTRKNLDGFAIFLMLFLCLLWGLQQVAIKLAAPAISSVSQLGMRSALAALLVIGMIAVRGIRFSLRDAHLLPGLLAGALFAAEFLCISAGLNYTSASHISVSCIPRRFLPSSACTGWCRQNACSAANGWESSPLSSG